LKFIPFLLQDASESDRTADMFSRAEALTTSWSQSINKPTRAQADARIATIWQSLTNRAGRQIIFLIFASEIPNYSAETKGRGRVRRRPSKSMSALHTGQKINVMLDTPAYQWL
jgi:hypothetical protein